MDPLFIGAAGLIAFAILMVAIAWRRWTASAQSLARIEALHALMAEAAVIAAPKESAPAVAAPVVAPAVPVNAGAPVPANAAGVANRFVVTVPDASDTNPYQLSFQRTESRS